MVTSLQEGVAASQSPRAGRTCTLSLATEPEPLSSNDILSRQPFHKDIKQRPALPSLPQQLVIREPAIY